LPPPAFGPESIAFESPGGAFYTGVSDGHIFKYISTTYWVDSFCLYLSKPVHSHVKYT
jgi:hypothetical protein